MEKTLSILNVDRRKIFLENFISIREYCFHTGHHIFCCHIFILLIPSIGLNLPGPLVLIKPQNIFSGFLGTFGIWCLRIGAPLVLLITVDLYTQGYQSEFHQKINPSSNPLCSIFMLFCPLKLFFSS